MKEYKRIDDIYNGSNKEDDEERSRKFFSIQNLKENGIDILSKKVIKSGTYNFEGVEKDDTTSYEDEVNKVLQEVEIIAPQENVDSLIKQQKIKEILNENNQQRKIEDIITDR